MSLAHVSNGNHVDSPVLCSHLKPCWCSWDWPLPGTILVSMAHVVPEAMLTSLACDAAEGYNGVHSLCCDREQYWCLWSALSPTRDHAKVHGSCWQQRPCKCPWSMYQMTVKSKTATFAGTDDCRLTVEKEENRKLLGQPFTPLHPTSPHFPEKSSSLDRKSLKRTLKNCKKVKNKQKNVKRMLK